MYSSSNRAIEILTTVDTTVGGKQTVYPLFLLFTTNTYYIYRQNELVNEKPLLVASLEAVFVLRTKLRAAMDIVYCILFILHTRYLVIFSAALARH